MHHNAPSRLSNVNHGFVNCKRFIGEKILQYLPLSSVLNSIEMLWLAMMTKLYEDGKQYNGKAEIWEAIKTTT